MSIKTVLEYQLQCGCKPQAITTYGNQLHAPSSEKAQLFNDFLLVESCHPDLLCVLLQGGGQRITSAASETRRCGRGPAGFHWATPTKFHRPQGCHVALPSQRVQDPKSQKNAKKRGGHGQANPPKTCVRRYKVQRPLFF